MGEEHKQEHFKVIRKFGGRTNLIGLFIMVYGTVVALYGAYFFPLDCPVEKMEVALRWGTYTVLIGGLIIAGLLKAEDILKIIKFRFGSKKDSDTEKQRGVE